ncbi:MAG: hypothetical protein PUP93_15275 [Rhizonema sp. NSF051]|nr:hypothetical protein [Rhizonema sp. NSF051]
MNYYLKYFCSSTIRVERSQPSSVIQKTPHKIAALRKLSYKYTVVGQNPQAAQNLQVVKTVANGTEKSGFLVKIG